MANLKSQLIKRTQKVNKKKLPDHENKQTNIKQLTPEISDTFKLEVIHSGELRFQSLEYSGLVVAVKQNTSEIWVDFDKNNKKIRIKIPAIKNTTKLYEFTVSQLIHLIKSKAKEVGV